MGGRDKIFTGCSEETFREKSSKEVTAQLVNFFIGQKETENAQNQKNSKVSCNFLSENKFLVVELKDFDRLALHHLFVSVTKSLPPTDFFFGQSFEALSSQTLVLFNF